MKKVLATTMALGLLAWAGSAMATTYNFEDMIDDWTFLGVTSGAAYISEGNPLEYQHDLNDDVDFLAGDLVTSATLELDFTNDWSDSVGSKFFGLIKWNFEEHSTAWMDSTGTWNLGEVDNGQYSAIMDIDWLNDDGFLDVSISVTNALGTADAWLDHSRLYGTAETAPVPEPATMLLFGTGLLGLVGYSRKRANKS